MSAGASRLMTSGGTGAAPKLALGLVGAMVVVKLAMHLGTNALGPYGFHRDEFLYMAMGEHLRLWHMDFPPFMAMLSQLTRGLLGDSLVAVRFFPAVFSSALLVLAALIARDLGGKRFAQGLAALCVLAITLFQRSGNLFQPVVIDQLWWTVALYALVRLGNTEDQRWWLVYGGACGLGLLSKFSMLILGLSTLLALVVTSRRRDLTQPWVWAGAGIALALGSPSIIGQIVLDYPVLTYMDDLRGAQLARVTAGEFLMRQIRWGPAIAVAAVGIGALLTAQDRHRFRVVGWTCLWAFVILLAAHGKPYYIGPVYPTLFAAGAVAIERLELPRWAGVIRWTTVVTVTLYGILLLPLGVPILRPETMERYLARLGSESAVTTNVGAIERLPQDYADMLGWEEQVAALANVYESLDPTDRAQAVLFADNYGEAGAIDFYGPRYGLPKAVAFVGTYWFFGPGEKPGTVTIAIGFNEEDLDTWFESVTPVAHVTHPFAVEEERDLVILLCRRPHETFQEVWPSLAGAT